MATDAIVEPPVPSVDPALSKSAADVGDKPNQHKSLQDAESAASDDMFRAAEEVFKAQPDRPSTEPDKPVTKPADTKEPPADRKLPPPIKTVKREPAPESTQKPPELSEDDLARTPYEKWPRTAQQWKEARELSERQINHYKAEVSKLKDQSRSGGPEVQEIIRERDQLRDELRAVAVERDPAFKSKYDNAFAAVRQHLESVLSKDDSEKALGLFDLPPGVKRTEALEKFTEGLSPIKQSAITTALLDHDKTVRARDSELSEARKNWDKIQLESRASAQKAEREFKERHDKAFNAVVKEWTDPKEGYEWMRKTGDAEADAKIDETVDLAKAILSGENTPDEMARAAMYAAISPRLIEAYIDAQSTIDKLKAEIKQLKTSSPGLGTAGGSTGSDTAPSDDTGYGEAIAKIAAQSGLSLRPA